MRTEDRQNLKEARRRCSAERRLLALFRVALLLVPARAQAGYEVLETKHLRLVYRDFVHSALAPHTARCFENAFLFYRDVLGYSSSEKITVLLEDAYDFSNGAASAVPRSTIVVHIAPASMVYETMPGNERINHTLNHELAHIVALDQAAGSDRFFRALFRGKVATAQGHPETILYEHLTHPRSAAPRWYHEGLATFLETWMAGGIGRAQGAYDEMVFRSMVRDSISFYDPLGLESEGTKVEFQVGAMSYLYGTRFVTWLGYEYSPQAVIQWMGRHDGSSAYYSKQFQKVFGTSLDAAWRRWVEWERGFQRANLDSIRLHPRTPVRDISGRALGSVSRAYVDGGTGRLYAGLTSPGKLGHMAAISLRDGSQEPLCDIKGAVLYFVTSLAWDPDSRTLFFTGDNAEWRDLWMLDPDTRRARRVQRDSRIGDLVFDRTRGCLWGVRHFNGISTLVRIQPPYRDWNQIHSWPYGQDPYDLDVSPDGRWLSFSLSQIDGSQSLRLAEVEALARGEDASRTLYDFGASIPANFVFSPSGRYLYGSSYYTGVSNIWRYDLQSDSIQVVSNCETGLFRPVPVTEDSLLVFRYSGEGFVPAWMRARPLQDVSAVTYLGQKVAEKHPVVLGWNVGSPMKIHLDSLTVAQGRYRDARSIRLESVVPVVQGYKDDGAAGLRFALSDPGYWNAADVTVAWAPGSHLGRDERLHVDAELRHLAWKGTLRYNHADFYDLFGPTKRGRKGWAAGLHHDRRLIYDRPRLLDLALDTMVYTGLERLPDAQNVAASYDKLWTASAALRYQNVRRSLGAVDEEKGLRCTATLDNQMVNRRAYPHLLGTLDLGHPVLVGHSSLWLRSAAGWSPGDRDEPFANFFFGGYGNNWVDRLDEKRYREPGSFPGLELDAAGGTSFAKTILEWNLPPLRFRRLGTPSFYVTWARPALFATGLVTEPGSAPHRRKLVDAGIQVDVRFTLLSRLAMTFSAGHAAAFEEGRRRRSESMVSLKVL